MMVFITSHYIRLRAQQKQAGVPDLTAMEDKSEQGALMVSEDWHDPCFNMLRRTLAGCLADWTYLLHSYVYVDM